MVTRRRGSSRMATLVVWGVLLFLPVGVLADSPEEIFERGNRAYDEGRFEDAAEAFTTLLRYQIEDPRVEYNLGNAEFRLGNLGQAILHYERALRLSPTDPDILANLRFARTQRLDRVPDPERPAVVGWIVDLQDRVGPDRQAWLLLLTVWLIGGVLGWGLAVPGRWGARHGWGLAGLALVLVVLGTSWYATYDRLEGRNTAIVVDKLVEVLAGPGQNNATLATVHEGLDVEIWGEREEWIQVRLPNGVSGWVARGTVEPV